MAKNNSKSILPGTFDSDPEECLNKSLVTDLKKTSEEKFFDAIIEKLLNNGTCFIKHRNGINAFRIRKDQKKAEKDKIIKVIETIDSKIKEVRINQAFHS